MALCATTVDLASANFISVRLQSRHSIRSSFRGCGHSARGAKGRYTRMCFVPARIVRSSICVRSLRRMWRIAWQFWRGLIMKFGKRQKRTCGTHFEYCPPFAITLFLRLLRLLCFASACVWLYNTVHALFIDHNHYLHTYVTHITQYITRNYSAWCMILQVLWNRTWDAIPLPEFGGVHATIRNCLASVVGHRPEAQ